MFAAHTDSDQLRNSTDVETIGVEYVQPSAGIALHIC
jgi:hypothetical protein